MFAALIAAAGLVSGQAPPVAGPDECAFAAQRVAAFLAEAPPGDVRSAVSAQWLSLDMTRDELAALLAQTGRERGPDASFAMGYRPDFARAIEALSVADMDRVYAALTQGGPIRCADVDTGVAPFTEDLAAFNAWAGDQMMNPDPGAPEGAKSLALSRPVIFDGGDRALVMQAYAYTPIPLSRPPSALAAFVVYEREDGAWAHAASLVLERSG